VVLTSLFNSLPQLVDSVPLSFQLLLPYLELLTVSVLLAYFGSEAFDSGIVVLDFLR